MIARGQTQHNRWLASSESLRPDGDAPAFRAAHPEQETLDATIPALEPVLLEDTADDEPAAEDLRARAATHFLRSFHVLLRSVRLYQKNHPRILESLETTERHLRAALDQLPTLSVAIERGRLSILGSGEPALADSRGELAALAQELGRCGVVSIVFLAQTNLGELDTMARVVNDILVRGGARPTQSQSWPTRLARNHIHGIRVNSPIERKVDTVLTSLVAALLAHGGAPELGSDAAAARPAPSLSQAEFTSALRLLARITAPVELAQHSSPPEAARAIHAALAKADRRAVSLLVDAMTRHTPHEEEQPRAYLARLAEDWLLEFAGSEFSLRHVGPTELRDFFTRLAGELAVAAGSALALKPLAADTARKTSWLAGRWAEESYPERLHERFWSELPAREKFEVLQTREAWCVPIAALPRYFEQLAEAGPETSGRQARQALLNYVRCLEFKEDRARRAVSSGLTELLPLLERLWPHQLPEELSRTVLRALEREVSPGIAGLLAAVVENLARLALVKPDYAEFERILQTLENAPRDTDHAHMVALAGRLVTDERWLLLIDAALENRALDPVLPRLLRRDPERLLDRLGLLLTAPAGLDSLPAMARLLRAVGDPAMETLDRRLFEPRRQRTAAAVKLLAATQPDRLVAALPCALPSWDWSLQDMAISELSRMSTPDAPAAFLACVVDAHPLVVPMMLDEIGMAQESAAVPVLLEIAGGENLALRDVFIRIKAIEALGRIRAVEAADLLRAIVRQRNGLTHAEPAGLRAAAEEALALIENHPSSSRIRAAYEALEKAGQAFTRPRRYLRIPLPSPFTGQIEGAASGVVRVRTISLGGAFVESNRRLTVGDSIRLEIRAGLRRIHSTAVVRNVSPNGGGVEFVHMKQEDREKLRRLVRRLQKD